MTTKSHLTPTDRNDYCILWHWCILRNGVYETSDGTKILPKAERLTKFCIEKFGALTEKYTTIRWK